MLTAISAFEFAHKFAGLFADLSHLLGAIASHVQDRAHVQGAYRGMRIPSAFGAMPFKNFCQGVGVFGQMHQRNSAVFNKAHRFAVALQAHHDVEACFTNFP